MTRVEDIRQRLQGFEFSNHYNLNDCMAAVGLWTPWLQGIDRYDLARFLLTRCRAGGRMQLAEALLRFTPRVQI